MELNLSPSEQAFREEVDGWLREHLPDEWRESRLGRLPDEQAFPIRQEWSRRLGRAGWLGIAWPKVYGGRGVTLMEQVIFQDEMLAHDAPSGSDGVGVQLIGPTIIELGTDEQKRAHLGPIIRGESTWYQGFSEPNAGSDLAALETRAVLDGDEYVITGQKLWGGARHADWGAVLARTDTAAPKHRGLSYFLVDMKTPGVKVGQIRDISDRDHLGEVYFDGVRVPRTNILGPLNEGWRVVNRTLVWERGVITLTQAAQYIRQWHALRDYARTTLRSGRPLAEDPSIRERLAQSYCDTQLMRLANLVYLTRYVRGEPPGLETSYMKQLWVVAAQRLADLAMELGGPEALLMSGSPNAIQCGEWTADYFYSRAVTIYGGTQDIQRNIIAERIFGLPRGN